jgi:hypothetical protein
VALCSVLVLVTGCAGTRARHAAAHAARAQAAAAASAAARPGTPPPASPVTDQFALRAGYYLGSAGTEGRVDDAATSSTGTPFSLEDDFHLSPHAHQLRVEMMFRMRERNRLRVDMWELNRNGVAAPTTSISYGGNTFTPADSVHSRFDWRQIDFTYTYSILQRERFELGVGLGVHLLQAEAEAQVAPGAGRPSAVDEDFSGAGPFATVAIDGSWRVTRRFAFSARGQYLRLHVSSLTAALSDYHADVQFRWRPNLAVGLGYQSTQTRLEVQDSANNGYMRLDLKGPELFLRTSF